jgi:hypothetical protein
MQLEQILAIIGQPFHDLLEPARRFGFDNMLGHSQPCRDFLLRHALDPPQPENLTAAVGELVDDREDLLELHARADLSFGRRRGVRDIQRFDFRQHFDPHDLLAAKALEHDRARRGEQIGLAIADVAHAAELRQADVGLLHQIVDLIVRSADPAEPGAKLAFVGNDVAPHPGDNFAGASHAPDRAVAASIRV